MSARNPFKPGAGGLPPYLAGRATEQALLLEAFEGLRAGIPPAQALIFYGPRGNGKTALLAWTEQQIEEDDGLDGVWLTPADIPAPERVVGRLQLNSWIDRIAPEHLSVAGVSLGLRPSEEQPVVAAALEARAKARPFVVFLDEAHTINAEVGRLLLNAAQTASRRSPFLPVLAGTPDLPDHLGGIGASFWDRGDIRPLGRLDAGAAAEAIRRPLDSGGVEIEPAALDRIVRESHGYPYFLQVWGQAVWKQAAPSPDGSRRVTTAVVEEATPEFEATRNRYYQTRYKELKKAGLLRVGREVAVAFGDRAQVSDAGLDAAIQRGTAPGTGPDEESASRTLQHLGLVWQSDGAPVWEPGIPSLMDYLLEYVPARKA